MNTSYLNALKGQNHDHPPPIWVMRQAGRYLPEYRALRRLYPLLQLFRTPEMVAHITMLPIDRLGMDAAILYTDILIILDALGIEWNVKPGFGPLIEPPIQTAAQVKKLKARPACEALHFVLEGIDLLRAQLKVPLIGFCGGPFTIASYLVQGQSSRDFKTAKQWMYREPDGFHALLSLLAEVAIDFLNCQIDHGIQAVQIFDSWAHALTPRFFKEFSQPYLRRIMDGIAHRNVPVTLFCRGSQAYAPLLAECRPDAISLDWQCDLAAMRKEIPREIAIQGNLDPCALYAPKEVLQREIDAILNVMQGDPGFVFNLGHGVLPDTPVAAVEYLVERVRNAA